jgi:hypothetical protein
MLAGSGWFFKSAELPPLNDDEDFAARQKFRKLIPRVP